MYLSLLCKFSSILKYLASRRFILNFVICQAAAVFLLFQAVSPTYAKTVSHTYSYYVYHWYYYKGHYYWYRTLAHRTVTTTTNNNKISSHNNVQKPSPVTCSHQDIHINCGPTLSGAQVNDILQQYNSPVTGMGNQIYALSTQYHVDDAFVLAVFFDETRLCTVGYGGGTGLHGSWRNCGNMRIGTNVPTVDGFAQYPSYQASINDWYLHISKYYLSQPYSLVTINTFGNKYCPPAAATINSTWVPNVESLTSKFRTYAGR